MPIPLTRVPTSTIITLTKAVTKPKESQKLFFHPVKHVEGQAIPQRNATMVPMHRRPERQNQVQEKMNQKDTN